MRKVLCVIVVLFALVTITSSVFAQGDASLWVKMRDGHTPKFIPWVTYDSGKMFAEARFNFDWDKSSTLFLGKSFQVGGKSLVPEIGIIYGKDYKAVTPQLLAWGGNGRFGWYALNQGSFSTNNAPHFFYDFISASWKFSQRLSAKLNGQVYWEEATVPAIDIGPAARVIFPHGLYSQVWGTVNPANGVKKFFVGMGTAF